MIVDYDVAADGRLYVLLDTGAVRFQDPNIGTDYQHMPASQRPSSVWRTLPDTPAGATRIRIGPHGLATVLCGGQLYTQARTGGMIEAYVWQPVPISLEAP